jgi:hypothetical protein
MSSLVVSAVATNRLRLVDIHRAYGFGLRVRPKSRMEVKGLALASGDSDQVCIVVPAKAGTQATQALLDPVPRAFAGMTLAQRFP